MFKIEKIQKKDNNTGVISFYLYDFEHQIFFDYVIKKVKKDYDYLDYNYSSSTDEEVGGFVYKNSITCPINDDIDIIFFKLIESYNKIVKFEKYNTIIKENFWTKRYTHEEKSINQKKEEVSRIKNDIDFILSNYDKLSLNLLPGNKFRAIGCQWRNISSYIEEILKN